MTNSKDYKKHRDYDSETNKNLDIAWKNYIDLLIASEKIEEEHRKTIIAASKSYDDYVEQINLAIVKQYGEPFLDIGQELLVFEDSYIIREAERYNKTFPKSTIVVPYVGEVCRIGGPVKMWPIPDNIIVVQPSLVNPSQYTWSNYHVPYIEAQRMRQAYLNKYGISPKGEENGK